MFSSVLTPATVRKKQWFGSALIALLAHANLVALLIWTSGHDPLSGQDDVPVTFIIRPPPPLPAPPPAHASQPRRPPLERKAIHRPSAVIRPQVIPEPKRPEIEPEASVSGNVAGGGVEGGVVGGLVGGALGGAVTGLTAKVVETPSEPVEFNNSMTPPTKVFGPEPQYTQRALDYQVEGLMLVKCIVTRQGGLRNCRVLNSLPFMESAVLSALEQRRYRPALFQGKPIDVYYTFRIRLRLPR